LHHACNLHLMTPLDKLNLFLFLIQVKFVMAGVINSGSLSIVDSNPTATSCEVAENVEQAESHDSKDGQKGPMSPRIIATIVGVLRACPSCSYHIAT